MWSRSTLFIRTHKGIMKTRLNNSFNQCFFSLKFVQIQQSKWVFFASTLNFSKTLDFERRTEWYWMIRFGHKSIDIQPKWIVLFFYFWRISEKSIYKYANDWDLFRHEFHFIIDKLNLNQTYMRLYRILMTANHLDPYPKLFSSQSWLENLVVKQLAATLVFFSKSFHLHAKMNDLLTMISLEFPFLPFEWIIPFFFASTTIRILICWNAMRK